MTTRPTSHSRRTDAADLIRSREVRDTAVGWLVMVLVVEFITATAHQDERQRRRPPPTKVDLRYP